MPTGESRILIALLVVVTAFGTVVQSRINGELVVITRNPFEIGILNFIVGLVACTILVVSRRAVRTAWTRMMTLTRRGQIRWWECLGGICGTYFVTVQSGSVPILGVSVFTVAVVAGQATNAAVLDRIGLGPAGRQPVSALRICAVILAIVAVVVSVSDRFDSSRFADSRLSMVFALLAISAGLVSAVQSALNGRVAQKVGHGMAAGWMNFAVGTVVGLPIAIVLSAATGRAFVALPLDRPWLLIGGALALLYVATVAWAIRPLGILGAAVLSVVGLLLGALVIDLLAPTPGTQFGWHLVVGVLLAIAAAGLAALGRTR
ncbi:MAG: DMT family transporter [Actinomycetes bacterium]